VGIDSGRILREAMVARSHYMVTDYWDFDGDVRIESPLESGGPVGTPASAAPPTAAPPDASPVAAAPVNAALRENDAA
jgi:hypothetical protein